MKTIFLVIGTTIVLLVTGQFSVPGQNHENLMLLLLLSAWLIVCGYHSSRNVGFQFCKLFWTTTCLFMTGLAFLFVYGDLQEDRDHFGFLMGAAFILSFILNGASYYLYSRLRTPETIS